MQAALIILGVILVVALIIVASIHDARRRRERREALARLAHDLGWSFDPEQDGSHDDRYRHFSIFRQGHSRAAYNTLVGTHEIGGYGYRVKMGDYTYKITTSTGKTTTTATYRFSYAILDLPFDHVPNLLIRREGFFDKLKGVLGFDDIDFESEEFSRKFHVSSGDKRFAYDVIHSGMMEFLMRGPKRQIHIERGQVCLVAGSRECWTPDEFETELGWIAEFFALWPDHLTSELARRST